MGAAIGLIVIPSHDFFSVVAIAAVVTFLTTLPGFVGDAARMTGYAVVSLFKMIFGLEKKFELLRKIADFLYDVLEVCMFVTR